MSADTSWEESYRAALESIKRGDFDEIKSCLEALGFQFRETKDPNHWLYFHPLLRDDPVFRTSRNLYRPHGRRRDCGRIARVDQSKARQMVEALNCIKAASEEGGDDR